ncbi:MAG TPA: DinB family protein, partial [Bacteroidia bacterium]|nr:DinB family protein [Bacteroidia bacterium]
MTENPLEKYGVEIPEWYQGYVNSIGNSDFTDVLLNQYTATPGFLEKIPVEKWDYSYASGKWTIKELLIHVIDCERIFAYRALRFARNDQTELPGFEENDYAPNSGA